MTPEEQIAKLTAELETAKANGVKVGALESQLAEMKKANEESQKFIVEARVKDARNEAIAKYPQLKDFEDQLTGTPEEIRARAEAMGPKLKMKAEEIAKREAELKQQQWNQLPGNSTSSLAISKDRRDEYDSVWKSTLPKMMKVAKVMAMKVMDLRNKNVKAQRESLGI